MWQELAACRGMEIGLFFARENIGGPKSGRGISGERERVARAKEVCAKCVVIQECLEYAIRYECVGIWGGFDTQERHAYANRVQQFPDPVSVV